MQAEDLLALLGSAVDWQTLEERGAKPRDPGSEWVRTFAAHSTNLPDDAALLPATLDLAFPARHQSRTVVQGVVRVPATAAVAAGEKDDKLYRFLVDGEVLRRDELFESFRYRFEVPAADAPAQIPLLLERYLRPGDYRLLLRVEDLNGGSFFRHEGDAHRAAADGGRRRRWWRQRPPYRARRRRPRQARRRRHPRPSPPPRPRRSPTRWWSSSRRRPPTSLTGRLRVAADVRGPGVARVRFLLDGQGLLAKARPPYTVELDLGEEPRLHQLAAVAEAADGHELARDEVAVNAGPHRFAVRLVEPKPGAAQPGQPVRAEAIVEVPGGERLDRLELFVDETHLATLYQPPFVQSLLPPATAAGLLRARGRLPAERRRRRGRRLPQRARASAPPSTSTSSSSTPPPTTAAASR